MAKALDLKKANAKSFCINVACTINDSIKKEMEKLIGMSLEERKPIAFGVVRGKGEDKRIDIAICDYVERPAPHLHITFIYNIENVPSPPRGIPKPYRLIQIIKMSEEPMIFMCEASFLYKGGAERSIIKLPISVFRTDKAGFDTIKGVHLSRSEPEESKYDIRITLDEDGSIEHEVEFHYESMATPNIERFLFGKAEQISRMFLN